jgi:hypothetical protein
MPVVRRIRGGRNFVASLGSILEAGEAAVSGKVSFISSTDYFRREYPRGSWKRIMQALDLLHLGRKISEKLSAQLSLRR